MSIIYINCRELDKIIKQVWNEFWPSNAMGKQLEKVVGKTVNTILTVCCIVYISGLLFSLGFLTAPYISGNRVLPYRVWYPFDWKASPTYELLYILSGFTNMYLVLSTICGYDFLFFGMCLNISSQFQLTGKAITMLGTKEEKMTCDKLLGLKGVPYKPVFSCEEEEERELILICIRHHQKLIR